MLWYNKAAATVWTAPLHGTERSNLPMRSHHTTCSIPDCNGWVDAHGWCHKHYEHWRRYGDPVPQPRPVQVCSVDGCRDPVEARDWCAKHYKRWQVHGSPAERSHHSLDRLHEVVTVSTSGCWEWNLCKTRRGYGHLRLPVSEGGGYGGAHRAVYERLVGPVPDGLELDHLCRNPSCVNPSHLEPVTHRVNLQRASDGKWGI